MQFHDQQKKPVTINITSLIDVMFILIIFFMVSSSFIDQPGMKLELPTTENQETVRVEKLVIYISKEGKIFLNDEPIQSDSLMSVLKGKLSYLENKTLVLKADKAAEHGLVVRVMDISKRSGMEKIVIGTRVEE